MLRVCTSIQNVERSLLLLVVSASDIPLRTIKFFSVVFSSAYWSMLQAVTNKHSMLGVDNARSPIMNDHGKGHVARLGSSRLTDCAFTVWKSRQRGPVVGVVVY